MNWYRYWKACPDLCTRGEIDILDRMVHAPQNRSITYKSFVAAVGAEEVQRWARDHGYDRRKDQGLTLEQDWHVSYHRSIWGDEPCYYLVWSAQEHIWRQVAGPATEACPRYPFEAPIRLFCTALGVSKSPLRQSRRARALLDRLRIRALPVSPNCPSPDALVITMTRGSVFDANGSFYNVWPIDPVRLDRLPDILHRAGVPRPWGQALQDLIHPLDAHERSMLVEPWREAVDNIDEHGEEAGNLSETAAGALTSAIRHHVPDARFSAADGFWLAWYDGSVEMVTEGWMGECLDQRYREIRGSLFDLLQKKEGWIAAWQTESVQRLVDEAENHSERAHRLLAGVWIPVTGYCDFGMIEVRFFRASPPPAPEVG